MKRLLFALALCASVAMNAQEKKDSDGVIMVIYENDAHGTLSGYPKMATLKSAALGRTPYVLTVSGGDFSADFMPSPSLARNSKGEAVVKIMNAVGYDYAVPGNHDFDFGVPVLKNNASILNASVLCCNLVDNASGELVFPAYELREIGGRTLAFVGVATPKSVSRQLHDFFYDADGNLMYSFCDDSLIEKVQQSVDKARSEGADFVIVISHLGDKPNGSVTSTDLIAQTCGIDVVLDAHAHSVIAGEHKKNKDGKDVLLGSTGLKFANIGELVIYPDGRDAEFSLVPCQGIDADAATQKAIESISGEYNY